MPPELLRKLLHAPDSYKLFWLDAYANISEYGVFAADYRATMTRYKVSRTTLQRILQLGDGIISKDTVVGAKWANNRLEIKEIDTPSGRKVGVKRKKSKPATTLFSRLVEVYSEFHFQQTTMTAKMDAIQGAALKKIIKYLETQVRLKQPELSEQEFDEQIILALKYVFSQWHEIEPFYQRQIKLTQINSNLPNIVAQIVQKRAKKDMFEQEFTDDDFSS